MTPVLFWLWAVNAVVYLLNILMNLATQNWAAVGGWSCALILVILKLVSR